MKKIHWIEYDGKHYLSIGSNAPWLNRIQIRMPKSLLKKIS